jgi:hypothetical protein
MNALIFHNHVVDTLFWKLLEGILKGPNNQNRVIVDLAKVLLTIFSSELLPPDALTLRNNEYMADATALRVTRDIKSAKSCLLRLCNNNLNSASHLFDLVGKKLPAMILGSRIKEMEKKIRSLSQIGTEVHIVKTNTFPSAVKV